MSMTQVRSRGTSQAQCSPGGRITRSLLGYGVLAGPVYVVTILVQAALRPGFSLIHDDASLLSNGSLGWIQIANFVVTGLMVVACAAGMHRALAGSRGTWGARLLAVYGLGLIAAGAFVADPMNGFPAGAPAGRPDSITVHGMLHIAAAGVGFACFVAACLAFARKFAVEHRRGWMLFSMITGLVFLGAFAGVASGSSSAAIIGAFWAALILSWTWLALLAARLYRQVS